MITSVPIYQGYAYFETNDVPNVSLNRHVYTIEQLLPVLPSGSTYLGTGNIAKGQICKTSDQSLLSMAQSDFDRKKISGQKTVVCESFIEKIIGGILVAIVMKVILE